MTKEELSEYVSEKFGSWPLEWRAEMTKMVDLLDLPVGWDSYGAPTLLPEVVRFALDFVLENIPRHYKPPQPVPCNHGGVQLEWNGPHVGLELYFSPPGRSAQISFYGEEYASDPTDGERTVGSVSGRITPNFPNLIWTHALTCAAGHDAEPVPRPVDRLMEEE